MHNLTKRKTDTQICSILQIHSTKWLRYVVFVVITLLVFEHNVMFYRNNVGKRSSARVYLSISCTWDWDYYSSCLIFRETFPTTSRVFIITLWIYGNCVVCVCCFCVCLCLWVCVNNLEAKTNGRTVWLKVQYLIIWYPIKILLDLYKFCLLKLREHGPKFQANTIYTNEADFR